MGLFRREGVIFLGWKAPIPRRAHTCQGMVMSQHWLHCPLMQLEQIQSEYRVRALSSHPDKHPGDPKAGTSLHFSSLVFSSSFMVL